VARRLAARAGGPIVSTSANPAGGPPAARVEDLDPGLRARVDGIVDAGPAPGGLASTVVVVEGGRPRLLRPGPIPLADVERALRPQGG
jgi:L-threonylcarbamoyladenylate synthase